MILLILLYNSDQNIELGKLPYFLLYTLITAYKISLKAYFMHFFQDFTHALKIVQENHKVSILVDFKAKLCSVHTSI